MGDVFEYIIDGTSGLVGGGVTGAIVAGVCSKGVVGKGYLCGSRTDLKAILGTGVLVDRLEDIFMTGGQNPIVIAVPVSGTPLPLPTIIKNRVDALELTLLGSSRVDADVIVEIIYAGELNVGRFRYSLDAGNTFSKDATLPIDKKYILDDTGVTISFAEGEYKTGDRYIFSLSCPVPTVQSIMEALEKPLQLYDVEFVYVTGATNATIWSALQAKADELFNIHRPTYFKTEARLKRSDEDINDWASSLIEERKKVSARFVQVTATFGNIITLKGNIKFSNIAGLEAGRTLAIPVQRATGRVNDGSIQGLSLTDDYSVAVQQTLESNDFITGKTYSGLNGIFFGDSKTLADITSDYRFQETVRVVFKGLRLARVAALKSMYDELGDPTSPNNMIGVTSLKTAIGSSLDTMTKSIPKELIDYVLTIPDGQDFVNNGVAIEITLIGIPIIRSIKLYANYTYAGSNFDPRMKEAE